MNLDAKNLITISSQYGVEKKEIIKQLQDYYSALGIQTKVLSLDDFLTEGASPSSINEFILEKFQNLQNSSAVSNESGPVFIVDSPTAFTLCPKALNIQLTSDPRYMATHKTDSQYSNMSEEEIIADVENHRKKMLSEYSVNFDNPDNYDAIIETDGVRQEQIASLIYRLQVAKTNGKGLSKHWCHPGKFIPTQNVRQSENPNFYDIMHSIEQDGFSFDAPVDALIVDGYYYVTDGHNRVGAACDANCDLITYYLLAKDDEGDPFLPANSARDYVKHNVRAPGNHPGYNSYHYYDHTWWKFDDFYDMDNKWRSMMEQVLNEGIELEK